MEKNITGKYQAIRRWKELYDPRMFINNLAIFLSIFSLTVWAATSLYDLLREWWRMIAPSPTQWTALAIGSVILIILLIASAYAFISVVVLAYRAIFGISVSYKQSELIPEIESGLIKDTIRANRLSNTETSDNKRISSIAVVVALAIGLVILITRGKRK